MGGHMIDDDRMHGPMMSGHSITEPGWTYHDGSYGMGFEFHTF